MATAFASPATPASDRIIGYDLARALAILGMVLVHFSLVMSFARLAESPLGRVVSALDGRAAATFVVLAGVGLALRSQRAAGADDAGAVRSVRATLIRRGIFLLVVGFLNLIIWEGDILRVYGVSLLLAPWLLRARDRTLWGVALLFVATFIGLFCVLDFSRHWDWAAMEYRALWTPGGAVRNLFFDGFRSVFPWTGLLVFGMWLGRRDLQIASVRRRFLAAGVGMVAAAEVASRVVIRLALSAEPALKPEEASYLFGTESMPPLPLFLISAVGAAVAVIAASVGVAQRFPSALLVRALVATGQLAFTWYVAHIVLGLGTLVALGLAEHRPAAAGLAGGLTFFALAAAVSLLWRRRFRHGPLEWLMRRVAG